MIKEGIREGKKDDSGRINGLEREKRRSWMVGKIRVNDNKEM